ncbi:MAG: hypothetical protein GWP91_14875, partial [Rhodobacterales bacterium]|nr:hypothetical protein [Rhodobacterales bacterium]
IDGVTTDLYDNAQSGKLRTSNGYQWIDPSTPDINIVAANLILTPAINGLCASICDAAGYVNLRNAVAVDELIEGTVLNHYDSTPLSYDAVTMKVILPVGVSGHREMVIWCAPAP